MSYDADQQNRMNRAKYEAMHFIEFDEQRQTAIIENSTRDSYYTVTMNSCTCPDFQKRGVPCKHIYKLREAIDNPASTIVLFFRLHPLKIKPLRLSSVSFWDISAHIIFTPGGLALGFCIFLLSVFSVSAG